MVSFGGQLSPPLEHARRRNKEKSTCLSTEDSCVAKSYSESYSVFLENGTNDGTISDEVYERILKTIYFSSFFIQSPFHIITRIYSYKYIHYIPRTVRSINLLKYVARKTSLLENERTFSHQRSNERSRHKCNSSWESLRDSERRKERKGEESEKENSNVCCRRRDGRRIAETLEELFSLTDIMTDEKRNSLYTLYKRSQENSRNGMLTEVEKIQLATTSSENGGKFVESNLWKHALLANRSSNNFCPANNSATRHQNDVPNYTRYTNEKYTFLRKGNATNNFKRIVRLRSTANLLDFNNRWIKGT